MCLLYSCLCGHLVSYLVEKELKSEVRNVRNMSSDRRKKITIPLGEITRLQEFTV